MLAWLFAGHMAGDFLLQNKWMAQNKTRAAAPLLLHSALYSAAVWLFSLGAGGGGLRPWWLAAIFISHVLLDNRLFVRLWCKRVTRSHPSEALAALTDQAWHIVALAAVCALDAAL